MLDELKTKIEAYDCSATIHLLSPDCSLEAIKAATSEGVLESTSYAEIMPSEGLCSLLRPLYTWLQKAITARETAMTYHQEAKEINLEVVVVK